MRAAVEPGGESPPADVRSPLWADLFAALVTGAVGGLATLPLGSAALALDRDPDYLLAVAGTTLVFAGAWCAFLTLVQRRFGRWLPRLLLGLPSSLLGVVAANWLVSTVTGDGFRRPEEIGAPAHPSYRPGPGRSSVTFMNRSGM